MSAKRGSSQRQEQVFAFIAVRGWFKCSIYPERHEGMDEEIMEHFFTVSRRGKQLSNEDVLQTHAEKFSYHEVIDYQIGRPWHYARDKYGRRVK